MSDLMTDLSFEGDPATRRLLADLRPASGGGSSGIVLLNLDGPIGSLLEMVGQMRASARRGAMFVGILPANVDPVDRIYLSAVVDAMVERPTQAASLHRAIADAMDEFDIDCGFAGLTFSSGMTVH